ncbi:hypothetical protein BSPLISOX_2556 [uncultured Gammaproteobacteria bacterium]|nr:hypothetical protein [uncultured Gammaproteobacteria bacterium]VVH64420.1 hypothetical protein BSPLISOX_2556 [uncultured Gammaproteobacteria bacterium]
MNNTPKKFYVLYPKDKKIVDTLNAIKILSDDSQRTAAHITVRGPYSKKLTKSKVDAYSEDIANTSLHFSEVANFFDCGQNTVFFKCDDNEKLRKIWNKKGYKDFKPHITLYNGTDEVFAKKLFERLQQNFKSFDFKVDRLSFLESKSSDDMDFYRQRLKQDLVNYECFKDILDVDMDKEKIKTIDEYRKLNYISKFNAQLYKNEADR